MSEPKNPNINTSQKPEILAPLNNWKSLSKQMKVLDNANAVYFGLRTNFSMRARADNFDPKDLDSLVQKVHAKGKKCYLTTNIVITNEELVELHQTIEHAHLKRVDAVICHDVAAIMIAKQIGMPFHISTQANISNKISAKYYEALGAERLILARELDLDAIKEIVSEVTIPIETFVHGAMCTAISGRCYLSSEMMGYNPDYSANKGKCIQPCRRIYSFTEEEGQEIEYDKSSGMFFNAKDLCMIGHIPEIIDAGITSLKIEGRMRDPLYIGEVVACYREAVDAHFDGTYDQEKIDGWLTRLEQVFNRGFHTGFYYSRPGPSDIERTVRGNVSKWHKKQVGKVSNYYPKAGAVEIDLFAGGLKVGDEIIFENAADFFYKQKISSLRLEDASITSTPAASANNHITIGLKVSEKVPINANVYIFTKRTIT